MAAIIERAYRLKERGRIALTFQNPGDTGGPVARQVHAWVPDARSTASHASDQSRIRGSISAPGRGAVQLPARRAARRSRASIVGTQPGANRAPGVTVRWRCAHPPKPVRSARDPGDEHVHRAGLHRLRDRVVVTADRRGSGFGWEAPGVPAVIYIAGYALLRFALELVRPGYKRRACYADPVKAVLHLPRRATYADYLAAEQHSESRLEFLDGVIVAMAGGSDEHNAILRA